MNPCTAVLLRVAISGAIVGVLLAGLAQPAVAQQQPPPSQPQRSSQEGINADRLPLDLHRIERQLRQSAVREEHDGLNLRYIVDVYGKAPRIELFSREDNLQFGQSPYGAPTHRQMIEAVTPKEYRAPAADFSGFMRWLQEKMSK